MITPQRAALLVAFAAATTTAAACGGEHRMPASGPARPVSASLCSPVSYDGPGRPQVLIAVTSWFQGAYGNHGVQTAQAIKLVLAQRRWRAGPYTVGVQSCEETDARTGQPSAAKCERLARAFAEDSNVLGVVGPLTSECGMAMLPALNRARGGPLASISGSNSYLGLTRSGPGTAAGEPGRYSPSGLRSFVRLGPADDAQGAADALMARRVGLNPTFVLEHDDPYGRGLAAAFSRAAHRIGLRRAGTARWNERAASYRPLAERIRASRPRAVFIAGPFGANGPKLVADLTAVLGPRVQLMAGTGFDAGPLVEAAGARAEGFRTSIPVLPNRNLPAAGRRFAAAFERRYSARPCCFSVHDAQATQMLLDAIARSGPSRSSVTEDLLHSRVRHGLLGDFTVDHNGDSTLNTVGIYRIADGRLRFETAITPDARLIAAG
jgi:branched-chain amino acid transport system substrate-binding protein